jgi:hypothetical protein
MRIALNGFTGISAVAILALVAWSGWWWIASGAQKAAVDGWMAERRAAGWVAETSETAAAGYPNRLDLTLTDLALADPAAGWAWAAPMVRIHQLSYRPDEAIVVFPPRQTLSVPGARLEAASDHLRASASLRPTERLALHRAVIEGEGLSLIAVTTGQGAGQGAGQGGDAPDWTASAAKVVLAVREADGAPPEDGAHAYDLSLTATEVIPPAALRALLGLGASLPATAERLVIDVTASFAAPLDLDALEGGGPQITALRLRPSELVWGELGLRATGRVSVDEAGYPDGTLTLRAENWRAALEAAISAGVVPGAAADTVRGAMEVVAFLAAKGEGLEAPLRFADRRIYLGPVPIGAAPRIEFGR